MVICSIKASFNKDLQTVWDTVTCLENYFWRSDIQKIEVLNETQFIEYTKTGAKTLFTVTSRKPFKQWEFDIENKIIKGHWTGIFTQVNNKTEICFTENVMAKNILLNPFIKLYLKRQQILYVSDLKRELYK